MFEEAEAEINRLNAVLIQQVERIDALSLRIEALEAHLPLPIEEPHVDELPTEEPPIEEPPVEEPPTIPPAPTAGIWLSRAEIMARPTAGAAWDAMQSAAYSNWGVAALHDNNSSHDVKTLAGALVAVRLGDRPLYLKVIDGLQSAMESKLSRALELSRGLQSYIIAAEIIDYRTPAFEAWVEDVVTRPIQGHSGTGLIGTAQRSPNNWGGMARAAYAAAAIYLDRDDWKADVVQAQREMIGLPVETPRLKYDNTTWHADPSNKAGINRKGATIQGVSVSGVLPEDWRRGGDFKWPPAKSGYAWEGMQGLVVTAVILHRAGLLPFNAGDNAIVRAMDMLYGRGEAARNTPRFEYPAEGDDRWIPWLVNHYAGADYPTAPDAQPGKGMGWTEWAFGD